MAVLSILRSRLWLALLALLALMAGALASGRAQQEPAPSEYEVKAAFLFNFAKFVEWPAEKLPPEAPLVLAMLGSNPFGDDLVKIVGGKQVLGHSIEVRTVSSPEELRQAHIAFISLSERRRFGEVMKALGDRPVLTVGEWDDFCPEGGLIRFRMVDGKVRIEVNTAAAERHQLKISSRLLTVAVKVWK